MTNEDVTTATVAVIPMCDICKRNGDTTVPAQYDAALNFGNGTTWAYACLTHFTLYGGRLGVGLGQRLIVGNPILVGFDEAMAEGEYDLVELATLWIELIDSGFDFQDDIEVPATEAQRAEAKVGLQAQIDRERTKVDES